MPSAVSSLAPVIGAVGGSIFGGSTPSAPNVQTWQPGGTAAADTSFQSIVNAYNANNPYAAYTPQATATFNSQYNNPYAPAYQTAANTAGTAFGNVGTQDTAASTALAGAGNTALTAANQTLNMGMDPQSTLYKQLLQQVTDRANATNAQTGVGNSPYGASVTNQATTGFDTSWQNSQLDRAIKALSGYTTGTQSAGSDFTQANTLGEAGAQAFNNAGAVPFSAANTVTGNQSTALTNLMQMLGNQGSGTYQTQGLNDLMSYLQLAAGQSNNQASLSLGNYQNALAQSGANQSGMGSLFSTVAANAPAIMSAFA